MQDTNEHRIIHSRNPAKCPHCNTLKVTFVLTVEGDARCHDCHHAKHGKRSLADAHHDFSRLSMEINVVARPYDERGDAGASISLEAQARRRGRR